MEACETDREDRERVLREAISAIAETAPVLGVSTSRVSQSHRKAPRTLRERLAAPLALAA